MSNRAEIDRLIDRLRELEDRVRDLELPCGDDAVGFDIGRDGEDFDEDDSEYKAVQPAPMPRHKACVNDLEYEIDLSMGFGPGELSADEKAGEKKPYVMPFDCGF